MHATIDVRFELSIDDDKTLPLATLAEAVTDQNLEAVLLESLVESLDAASVEALCGEKTHMAAVTSASNAPAPTPAQLSQLPENTSSLHYVEDTAASPDESSYFRPVEDVLDFDGQNRYQQDIAAKSVDLATSLSYRDAANHGDSFVSMPSPTTINRRAKKYGHKLKQFLPDCVAGTDADAVIPDGTKCHSQDDDRSSHSVKQRSAKTPPKSHAPCWICRSTLTGTKLPPNSMISAQSLTTRRSSVTLIAASSQPLPTKTVTTSSISSTSAERWVTPSGTMASSPWTVGRRSFRR